MYKGAIIGGTGFESLGLKEGRKEVISTPYGDAEVFLGEDVVFVSRHREGHTLAPQLINYRANVWALKMLGVKAVVGIYCVGSITEKLSPGTVGIVSDFIDFSSGRENTFYDGLVNPLKHTDVSEVVDLNMAKKFALKAEKIGLPFKEPQGVYITTNGPRLETKAEIRAYRTLGCDFVGMTMGTEAPLIKELDMNYLPVAFSINWASGVQNSEISFILDDTIANLSSKITACALSCF